MNKVHTAFYATKGLLVLNFFVTAQISPRTLEINAIVSTGDLVLLPRGGSAQMTKLPAKLLEEGKEKKFNVNYSFYCLLCIKHFVKHPTCLFSLILSMLCDRNY